MTARDLIGHAQTLLDANLYLTLGTTSADRRPWISPVRPMPSTHATSPNARKSASSSSTPPSRRTTAGPCTRLGTPASCPATIWTQVSPCTPDPTNEAEV